MSDDLVERVARDLAFLNCSDQAEADRLWRNWRDDARAAIATVRRDIYEECARIAERWQEVDNVAAQIRLAALSSEHRGGDNE